MTTELIRYIEDHDYAFDSGTILDAIRDDWPSDMITKLMDYIMKDKPDWLYTTDESGNTVLHLALYTKMSPIKLRRIIEILANKRSKKLPSLFDIVNQRKETPLHMALFYYKVDDVRNVIYDLIYYANNIDQVDAFNFMPLHYALMYKHEITIIETLIFETTRLDFIDKRGRDFIEFAIAFQNTPEVIKLLKARTEILIKLDKIKNDKIIIIQDDDIIDEPISEHKTEPTKNRTASIDVSKSCDHPLYGGSIIIVFV